MNNIIQLVKEKAGITEAQARKAIESVTTYIKDEMPSNVSGQVETFLKTGKEKVTEAADKARDKVHEVMNN